MRSVKKSEDASAIRTRRSAREAEGGLGRALAGGALGTAARPAGAAAGAIVGGVAGAMAGVEPIIQIDSDVVHIARRWSHVVDSRADALRAVDVLAARTRRQAAVLRALSDEVERHEGAASEADVRAQLHEERVRSSREAP
jgi:hypothetical protein